MERSDAALLCLVGAAMLLVGGFEAHNSLAERVASYLPSLMSTMILFFVSLGFFAFVLAAFLIYAGRKTTARVVMWLGTGVGLLGIFFAAWNLYNATDADIDGWMLWLPVLKVLCGVSAAVVATYAGDSS